MEDNVGKKEMLNQLNLTIKSLMMAKLQNRTKLLNLKNIQKIPVINHEMGVVL